MKNRITFNLAPGQTLADVLGTGNSRAKSYLMALAEAVRAAGLPKLPEDGAGLAEWLTLAVASKPGTARVLGQVEEAKDWCKMLASVTGAEYELYTACQAKRLLTDHIEQERQDARLEALKGADAAAFERGREDGLREAVRVTRWNGDYFLFRPDGHALKKDGKWESPCHVKSFPTREEAEDAKLTCAPWWVNGEAK